MSYISNETINEIRNKTDIVEVVSKYVNLTKTGKNYIGVCPFHDDHSPSMSVSPEKQIYTCFSCGATGNVFTFVSEFEKISFVEAVKLVGEQVGINVSINSSNVIKKDSYLEIYDLANKFYQNSLNTSLGKNAIEYLEKRNIDKETIKKFGIGLSIQKISLTDYLLDKKYSLDMLISAGLTNENSKDIFINRIMFPIYDASGNPIAYSGRIYNTKDTSKYINTKETDKFKKGKILYNYHIAKEEAKKSNTIIMVEGQMDTIRCSTIGISNVVATMGTALTKDHKLLLKNIAKNIILCFDGDKAGEKATLSAIELLEDTDMNIKVVRLPNNMDPDEYILKEGKESFINILKSATNLIDYKMELLKDGKDFHNIKDISNYINESLMSLSKEKDDIIVELNLKKLADNFNIEYEILKDKYKKINSDNKKVVIKEIKEKKIYDKYQKAENNLIFYMLKSEAVIKMVDKGVSYFPTKNIRELSNEIIYYFHKYGIISVADFISYIFENEELLRTLNNILAMDIKDNFKEEEIEDYIFVVNEYHKKVKIDSLNQKIKEEKDPLKQAKILEDIMKLRGVNKNVTRN